METAAVNALHPVATGRDGLQKPSLLPSTARLFFALWPDAALRRSLLPLVQPLRDTLAARWVKPENYHITLAFLGAVPLECIAPLTAQAACLRFEPCELSLQRLECWPRAQVLCLTAQPPPSLLDLVSGLNEAAGQLGLPVERRPFLPHLTLARQVRRRMPPQTIPALVWPLRDFCLVESRLHAMGSSYAVLRRWP